MYIDLSVYPDVSEPPDELVTDVEKADYIERICGALDFDIFPEDETLKLFRGWKEIFDRYPLPHSPAYHTLRRLMGWEDVPFPKGGVPCRTTYEILDRLEGRGPDPCESMV
jgi:hypothetical protein